MKKMIFIAPQLPFGGAEKQMVLWIKEAKKQGFYTIVISTDNKSEKITFADEQHFIEAPVMLPDFNKVKKVYKRIQSYYKISRFIKKIDYNYCVIFNQLYLPLTLNVKKVIFSIRELESSFFKGLKKHFQKKCSIVTTNNFPTVILAQSNSMEAKLIYNSLSNHNVRNISLSDKKNILVVSNIARHKNIHTVIKAVNNLKDSAYTLKIAGKIIDKEYYNELQNLSEGNRNIEFVGYVDVVKLEQLYNECSIVIHMSSKEGTANSIIDAIKYSKPVIVSEAPENILMVDCIDKFIASDEDELEKKLLQLQRLIECQDKELLGNMRYLQEKIVLNYNGNGLSTFMNKLFDEEINK